MAKSRHRSPQSESMSSDSFARKSTSPQSSTEVSSLQVNRLKNKEALERRLKCRPPIKQLVNQGILPNPYISHPDKVRQLQRAKTSDLLKQKIEKRPDRQSLVNRRIIREEKPGTSPYINEQCRKLEKCRLKTSLSSKLTARPGSLELIEKGVLQVDPGVDSLIRCGSLQYPRVEPPYCAGDHLFTVTQSIPTPPPLPVTKSTKGAASVVISCMCSSTAAISTALTSCAGLQRHSVAGKHVVGASNSRSMKDETVISKYGALVFHNYCPKSFDSVNPPASSSFLEKQRAREAQQADLLRLQDTAFAHHLVQKELCELAIRRPPHQDDVTIEAHSVSSTGSHFTQQSQSDQSHSLSVSNSPSQPDSVSIKQSPSSFTPQTLSESYSGGQSMNWLTDATNSMVFVLDTQSDGFGSESGSTGGTLAQLNKTQLRAECRERNLPRSGVKAALIRQLEPHSDEILSKYFSSPTTPISYDVPDRSPAPQMAPFHSLQSVSISPNGGPLSHSQPLQSAYPPPPPVWTAPVPSAGTVFTVSPSQWPLPTVSHAAGILVCPSAQTVQPVVRTAASLNTTPTTLLIAPQPALPFSSPTEIRHSNSAPFFTEMNGAISVPTHGSETVTQSLGHWSSVPSTSLIPVQFEAGSLSTNAAPNPHPIGMYLGMVQAPMLSGGAGVLNKPTIYLTSNVLSLAQATDILCKAVSTASPVCTTTTSAVFSTGQTLPSPTDNGWLFAHTSSFDSENRTVTESGAFHFNSRMLQSTHQTGASGDHTSSVELPSLGQIQNMWLRIRELRRVIAKAQESVASSSESSVMGRNSAQIQQLKSEHERLVTLFRLVIIARIDALNWGALIKNTLSSADLQVELKLMQYYLRILGGDTVAAEGGSVFTSGPRLRRASSPLLEGKTVSEQHGSIPKPTDLLDVAHETSSGPLTSTPRSESSLNQSIASCTETLSPSSWFNGSRAAEFNRGRSSPTHNPPNVPVPMDDMFTPGESSEPPSSPMTTDVLFELWDSVAKDNAQLIQTDTQNADVHCSSLPESLRHGSCGSSAKMDNHHFQCDTDDIIHQPMSTEPFDPPDNQMHANKIDVRHPFDLNRPICSVGNDQMKHSSDRTHQPSLSVAHPLLDDSVSRDTDTLHSPAAPSTVAVDVDWSSLISSSCLFPLHAQTERACTDPGYPMIDNSELSHMVSVSNAAIASHSSPLFHDLMDTADSALGLSPLVANWTGEA
ncbi:hypothetical protein D915_002345 [Fasciola hepatica]|uniref:SAP domain-containing protein n=1 Tax=Fasciola hepatica TaxID=6192 RepID=A0A4E0RGI8_FASHE|nr:hypothetical protein D915_002345 [Fasciola hepatica]